MPTDPILLLLGGTKPFADAEHLRVLAANLPATTTVIAADSGLDRAHAAGLTVDHLVGDLDSVDPAVLADAADTRVHRHPTDKDATDAELALRLAHDLRKADGTVPLLVVGDADGRIDHLLADIALLASPLTHGFRVRAHLGPATLTIVRPGEAAAVAGRPRELVSLLAHGGPVTGIETGGLRWPLTDATLEPGTTRGVSNELIGDRATIAVDDGVLIAVQQGLVGSALDDRADPYDPSPR